MWCIPPIYVSKSHWLWKLWRVLYPFKNHAGYRGTSSFWACQCPYRLLADRWLQTCLTAYWPVTTDLPFFLFDRHLDLLTSSPLPLCRTGLLCPCCDPAAGTLACCHGALLLALSPQLGSAHHVRLSPLAPACLRPNRRSSALPLPRICQPRGHHHFEVFGTFFLLLLFP